MNGPMARTGRPIEYWLSTLPEDVAFRQLHSDIAKLRWQESNASYQELKQEVGLGHFEETGLARLPPSRHPLHCGLRIPDLQRETIPPSGGSCQHAVPAICLTRRSPAQEDTAIAASERHVPNSIATMRRRLVVALPHDALTLPMLRRSERTPKFVTQ